MLSGESLVAGGHIENIAIIVGGDADGGYLLPEVIFNELYDYSHSYSFINHKYSLTNHPFFFYCSDCLGLVG